MEAIEESFTGIVNRVTYHNAETGWSVLRVQPFNAPEQQETVTVHQTKVFAGATMTFSGAWTINPKFGRQFKATSAVEKKPATTASLEKYLGSGLIKGVGPKTAKKIVKHFQKDTLDVFENQIDRLVEVEGIAKKKLQSIEAAWTEHRAIRDVMIFLQGHGISTLFAVKIFKAYSDKAIEMVTDDPYRLANDFYGIGFFSADKVALSIGLAKDSQQRITAAIKHILAASREQGHCFLTQEQINQGVTELIELNMEERLPAFLKQMETNNHLRVRVMLHNEQETACYYSKTLYYDEDCVAQKLHELRGDVPIDKERVSSWIERYCQTKKITLSDEQANSVTGIVQHKFSVLTGGPGCGKTTTTLVLVRLLEAMKKDVLLAAPTGRATQRMSEVIGREAKTIHRLLEFKGGQFQVNEEFPLKTDFLIVDECSMLDISLSASLFKAVPENAQVLLIGDADQLPSVGAGNVLKDIIASNALPCFKLTKIFRQAESSLIIKYAHQINKGHTPQIQSPFKDPDIWRSNVDCLFIDSDEATKEQANFITRVKRFFDWKTQELEQIMNSQQTPFEFRTEEEIKSAYEKDFIIPDKFKHVNLKALQHSTYEATSLKTLLKKIHPWSSLHYGLTAVDAVVKTYLSWIPKYQGNNTEIQILTPMTRGSLGSANLNKVIQQAYNPPTLGKSQIKIGERIFRVGDRIIHRRNNYDLNVFNGDIGQVTEVNNEDVTCTISFYPDNREVFYKKEDIMELDLAYAITIHKSQGSEFKTVIIPVLTQHFKMLYRNLIYTGLTRAKKLAIFIGTRKALAMAIRQQDSARRQTALQELINQVGVQ